MPTADGRQAQRKKDQDADAHDATPTGKKLLQPIRRKSLHFSDRQTPFGETGRSRVAVAHGKGGATIDTLKLGFARMSSQRGLEGKSRFSECFGPKMQAVTAARATQGVRVVPEVSTRKEMTWIKPRDKRTDFLL